MKETSKNGKRPSFQFYPADWLSDFNLSLCSLSAQGLFMRLLCIMFKNEKKGYLLLNQNGNQKAIKGPLLARLTGISETELNPLLDELTQNNVLKIDDLTGAFYSARMVRDEEIREKRAAAGRIAGPGQKSKENQKVDQRSNQNEIKTESNDQTKKESKVFHFVEEEEEEEKEEEKEKEPEILEPWPTFDDFWELYQKKVKRKVCLRYWKKLKHEVKLEIMEHLPGYIESTPNIQYRMNPSTYLNNESWTDQIINKNGNTETQIDGRNLFSRLASDS